MKKTTKNPETGSKQPVQRKVPMELRLIRWYFRIVGRLLPAMAARKAYKFWFRTQRFSEPQRETRWLELATRKLVKHRHGPLAAMQWGESGPTVLLVHGWNGRGSQMGAFAAPLVQAGFRVVAYDLPAHGRSPGNSTNIFKAIETLEAVAEIYGPIHAVIGHSFGGMVTALALKGGLQAKCVVCIGTPGSLQWLYKNFVGYLAIPGAALEILNNMINAEFGADIWDRLSVTTASQKLTTPALIIHDEFDADVDWTEAETIAKSWQGARFMKTSGLGHRRILRDPNIVDTVVEFINKNNSI